MHMFNAHAHLDCETWVEISLQTGIRRDAIAAFIWAAEFDININCTTEFH